MSGSGKIKSKELKKWLLSKDKGPLPKIPEGFDIEFPNLPIPEFGMTADRNVDAGGLWSGLQDANRKAIPQVAEDASKHLDAMMRAGWGWIDGARDIIDTGALMASQEVSMTANGFSVSYSAPYVNLVHYGGYIHPYGNVNIDKMYLPARPWISATFGKAAGPLPPFDMEASYYDAMAGYS